MLVRKVNDRVLWLMYVYFRIKIYISVFVYKGVIEICLY